MSTSENRMPQRAINDYVEEATAYIEWQNQTVSPESIDWALQFLHGDIQLTKAEIVSGLQELYDSIP